MAVALILTGYAVLIWKFGWLGVCAVAVHLIVMAWATRRG